MTSNVRSPTGSSVVAVEGRAGTVVALVVEVDRVVFEARIVDRRLQELDHLAVHVDADVALA